PQSHLQNLHDRRQPKCTIPIGPSHTIISASENGCAEQDRQQQNYGAYLTDFFSCCPIITFGALRLCPLANQRKIDRLTPPRGRFYSQRTRCSRPHALPCPARVTSGDCVPDRWSRLQLRRIEFRQRE